MRRAQLVSIFRCASRLGGAALPTFALLCLLASPSTGFGQDAGVSGIPPGPANARGLNGSVNDPSGIGNAAKVPAIPPPAISPPAIPSASPPAAYRSLPAQQGVRIRRPRLAQPRSRRASQAKVRQQHPRKQDTRKQDTRKQESRKQETLLDRKMSICRGC
jgi:hypothetical protein